MNILNRQRHVINTKKFSVALSHKTVVQLTNENRCIFALTMSMRDHPLYDTHCHPANLVAPNVSLMLKINGRHDLSGVIYKKPAKPCHARWLITDSVVAMGNHILQPWKACQWTAAKQVGN